MATARNGDVELFWESFGSEGDPTLLLVNGLGSQCISFREEWIELFVAEGHRVLRFDNRDVGLSTKLGGVGYGLVDMAADALAVLDAAGVDRAHVMGFSMGGMIVQRLAIDHPERLLSMTSVMSRTGEPEYGQSSPEALEFLVSPAATTKEEYAERMVAAQHVYGSKPEWLDLDEVRQRSELSWDRGYDPQGVGRQMLAVVADGSRADALRELRVPTLVIHGSRDTLIDPSGGRRTAELVPGARYEEIEGMGHDYPKPVWPIVVRLWADFVASVPV
jgi:pimeloyl-ACP methyl ester carboxylesterase